MQSRRLFWLLLVLFLTSCTLSAVPTPTATSNVIASVTLTASLTHTAIPTSTFTLPPAPTRTPTPTHNLSPTASVYLDSALTIMQVRSINRYQIDWNRMRSEAYTLANGAQTPGDTYNAIRVVLAKLGDRHSFFSPPAELTPPVGGEPAETPLPGGELLENRIGYVFLPGFSGAGEAADKYAVAAQQSIDEIDTAQPCGWIVDLRQDTGGNMWPMLAGIGPLLGEDRVGAFVYPDAQQQIWYYINGQVRLDEELVFAVNAESSQQLARSMPLVAVLTGHSTASSGEAIVVAFRGRPMTRSFGEETAGRSTSNQGFELSDGAIIALTVAVFADRKGQTYGSKIVPNQIVDRGTQSDDYVIKAAIEWLLKQPACIGKS